MKSDWASPFCRRPFAFTLTDSSSALYLYLSAVRRQNTVIHTYPAVSQFWKYSPEELLKQPVYSREFPPCRHC